MATIRFRWFVLGPKDRCGVNCKKSGGIPKGSERTLDTSLGFIGPKALKILGKNLLFQNVNALVEVGLRVAGSLPVVTGLIDVDWV